MTPEVSNEFYNFYKWLGESKYYTNDPSNACIRIPPIDFFNLRKIKGKEKIIGSILKQQNNWNYGKNSLILSLMMSSDIGRETSGLDSYKSFSNFHNSCNDA